MEESVLGDAAHLKECVSCASWLRKWLSKLGFEVELLYPGRGESAAEAKLPPPVVFAERKGEEGGSTVLVYGHYDVQPPDPLGEWKTPPFEPVVQDGRMYCRGANDDKGQTFALLCGMRDYLASEGRKINIKIVLDGQEESGSRALSELVPSLRRRLAADVLLVCDTSAAPDLRPAIVAGLRGVSHFTVNLTGPSRDLHSGEYGKPKVLNLKEILHYYIKHQEDVITRRTKYELAKAEALGPSEESLEADIGCEPCGGQTGKTLVQRNSFEPTIEVNGIHSGYGGPGAKTVIPSSAFAKISMRLVPGQSPRGAFAAVRAHLEDRCPKGMKISFEDVSEGTAAFRLPLASPLFRLAADVLSEMDPRGPAFQWCGASIPVLSLLREASGAAPLIVGWGQAEDRIHSPNESYSLAQFDKAREWGRRILAAL